METMQFLLDEYRYSAMRAACAADEAMALLTRLHSLKDGDIHFSVHHRCIRYQVAAEYWNRRMRSFRRQIQERMVA